MCWYVFLLSILSFSLIAELPLANIKILFDGYRFHWYNDIGGRLYVRQYL